MADSAASHEGPRALGRPRSGLFSGSAKKPSLGLFAAPPPRKPSATPVPVIAIPAVAAVRAGSEPRDDAATKGTSHPSDEPLSPVPRDKPARSAKQAARSSIADQYYDDPLEAALSKPPRRTSNKGTPPSMAKAPTSPPQKRSRTMLVESDLSDQDSDFKVDEDELNAKKPRAAPTEHLKVPSSLDSLTDVSDSHSTPPSMSTQSPSVPTRAPVDDEIDLSDLDDPIEILISEPSAKSTAKSKENIVPKRKSTKAKQDEASSSNEESHSSLSENEFDMDDDPLADDTDSEDDHCRKMSKKKNSEKPQLARATTNSSSTSSKGRSTPSIEIPVPVWSKKHSPISAPAPGPKPIEANPTVSESAKIQTPAPAAPKPLGLARTAPPASRTSSAPLVTGSRPAISSATKTLTPSRSGPPSGPLPLRIGLSRSAKPLHGYLHKKM